MKRRILTAIAALACVITLFSAGIAPAMAYAPPSGEGDASIQSEQVRWFYRKNNGVDEMRLWSITYAYWRTDWVPVPEGWPVPDYTYPPMP